MPPTLSRSLLHPRLDNASPTKEVAMTGELAGFDLGEWLEEYADIETAVAATIKKHNDAFTSFAAMQKDAFTKIEAHVLATNQVDWDRLQKDVRDAEAEQVTARAEEKGIADRQLELRNDLHDGGVGADKMNELILDLSRFDAAPLIAFTAPKEMNYGTETN